MKGRECWWVRRKWGAHHSELSRACSKDTLGSHTPTRKSGVKCKRESAAGRFDGFARAGPFLPSFSSIVRLIRSPLDFAALQTSTQQLSHDCSQAGPARICRPSTTPSPCATEGSSDGAGLLLLLNDIGCASLCSLGPSPTCHDQGSILGERVELQEPFCRRCSHFGCSASSSGQGRSAAVQNLFKVCTRIPDNARQDRSHAAGDDTMGHHQAPGPLAQSFSRFRGRRADSQAGTHDRAVSAHLDRRRLVRGKCRGNDGKAEANFITVSSRFPGHSWKPMDSLPLFPPPPYDMKPNQTNSADPSLDPSANREAWETLAMVDYESYESYLKTKGNSKVQIQGGLPEPLPFTISPLFLPDMIRNQLESADATFIAELAAGFELPGGDKHGFGLTMSLVDEEGKPITSPPVRFEPDSLKIDMMAAYPIMMPLHMAEFSYVEAEDGETRHLTFVMGGLGHERPTLLHEGERRRLEATRSRRRSAAPPYSGPVSATADQDAAQRVVRARARTREVDPAQRLSDLQSRLKEKLKTELPHRGEIEKRSAELLERADWIHWERDEREAFQARTARSDPARTMITKAQKERYAAAVASARKAPTDPRPLRWLSQLGRARSGAGASGPKGGARSLHLLELTPRATSVAQCVCESSISARAIPEVLRSRKQMASLAEGGYNVDTSLVKVNLQDGRKLSGDEAYQTVAANDLSMRQQREALKPRWLKALQNSFIRR
ncbi:hypothetical protein L1887_43439 [Cichorium endivia]|nr:hypothetical protein L1887_43439 [Cichorium endivia]